MVMPSNQAGTIVGYLAGRYPGSIGHLYSPGGETGPFSFIPYALDNGAFGAHERGEEWDEAAWHNLLKWSAWSGQRPIWVAVPDVVADRAGTIERWFRHVGTVKAYGYRPAFVLQDGMTFEDVPDGECMLFVGGTTEWKEAAIGPWCARFPGRVHVGRVNTWERLVKCWRAGAVSIDGTGWWHHRQRKDLMKFLEDTHGKAA